MGMSTFERLCHDLEDKAKENDKLRAEVERLTRELQLSKRDVAEFKDKHQRSEYGEKLAKESVSELCLERAGLDTELKESRADVEKWSQAARQRSQCVNDFSIAIDKIRIELKDANLQLDELRKSVYRVMKQTKAQCEENRNPVIGESYRSRTLGQRDILVWLLEKLNPDTSVSCEHGQPAYGCPDCFEKALLRAGKTFEADRTAKHITNGPVIRGGCMACHRKGMELNGKHLCGDCAREIDGSVG